MDSVFEVSSPVVVGVAGEVGEIDPGSGTLDADVTPSASAVSPPASARVVAHIDLQAIGANLRAIRRRAPQARVMAAVKAGAYGHGAVPVAKALARAGVDALAVACLEEAVALRHAGVTAPITVLEGALSADEARLATRLDVAVVVHGHWQIELLQSLAATEVPAVWLKLDTGMHRLGFPAAEAPGLWRVVAGAEWRFAGWITHFACADERVNPATSKQIECFDAVLAGLPGPRSLANSAGVFGWPSAVEGRDWVRPGLALYGVSPFAGTGGAAFGLTPAMRVESRLISVQVMPRGAALGYGATYVCPEDMPVGVAAVGYADGVPRRLPNGSPVLVDHHRAALVGRVSMDMILIDLRRVPGAVVGSPVTLWGPELPAEEVAAHAGTIAYELLCGLTGRVRFAHGVG